MMHLSDIKFEDLDVGMKFKHPEYGEQTILDLSIGQFGSIILFNNCKIYSGDLPIFEEEEGEIDIFQAIASQIYPYGADQWEYLGMSGREEIEKNGWEWWQVVCPHCGFTHRLLWQAVKESMRNCRGCGMSFSRISEKTQAPSM